MSNLPTLGYKDLARIFEKLGYKHIRTKGDHLIYEKPGLHRPIVIPKYKDVPKFIVKNNIRTAGITEAEFLKMLYNR